MGIAEDAITANPQRYEGYTIISQNEDDPNAQTSFAVVRDLDGTGLGAYASMEVVEGVIAADRRMQETLPAGLDYVPPLVVDQPAEPPQAPSPYPTA
jgi:hypothetical protein